VEGPTAAWAAHLDQRVVKLRCNQTDRPRLRAAEAVDDDVSWHCWPLQQSGDGECGRRQREAEPHFLRALIKRGLELGLLGEVDMGATSSAGIWGRRPTPQSGSCHWVAVRQLLCHKPRRIRLRLRIRRDTGLRARLGGVPSVALQRSVRVGLRAGRTRRSQHPTHVRRGAANWISAIACAARRGTLLAEASTKES
jgi:hypothetical protein